jgi:hypothetical protein
MHQEEPYSLAARVAVLVEAADVAKARAPGAMK